VRKKLTSVISTLDVLYCDTTTSIQEAKLSLG